MPQNEPIPRRQFVAATAAAVVAAPVTARGAHFAPAIANSSTAVLTPYLLFDGTCADAMHFYQSVFGGALDVSKVKDSVMRDKMPLSMQERVLSAHLRSNTVEFSASDWLRPDRTRVRGNTVCLYLSCHSQGELRSLFEKLSVGAEVNDPIKAQPFGTYGALNDKFGVRWMFWTGEKSA